jgi:hypothetical protein
VARFVERRTAQRDTEKTRHADGAKPPLGLPVLLPESAGR